MIKYPTKMGLLPTTIFGLSSYQNTVLQTTDQLLQSIRTETNPRTLDLSLTDPSLEPRRVW